MPRVCRRTVALALTALLVTGAGAASASGGHLASRPKGDAVRTWNANAGRAALGACIAPVADPLHEGRMYAVMHIAIHDALNAIDRRSQPYAYDARWAGRGASVEAAVATAAHDVLVTLIGQIPAPFSQACRDAGAASANADYAAALDAVGDDRRKARGVALGHAAAAAVLALRAGDGSDTPLIVTDYPQGVAPGQWRFTPGSDFAFAPGWGRVTPFVLRDAQQFRPQPPYDLIDPRYTEDFNEVKRLGSDGVSAPTGRTAEQTEIALFWVESSPLQWNRIARTVAGSAGLDDWDSARLFGLLNMALADGYISTFDTKYFYNFWRPVTAVRSAADDGNPDTAEDTDWTPLLVTPAIPDYDSGHSVEGGAASQVMRRFFRTDDMDFSACSLTLPDGSTCADPSPVLRSYSSFSQAAAENGLSRIYNGFHFRNAVQAGIERGERIGRRAVKRFLQPDW